MLERLIMFRPDLIVNPQADPVEITVRGTEPYYYEMDGYEFEPLHALFKAPNAEIARKFWNLSKIDKIEFAVQVSRLLDRIFISEETPYESTFIAGKTGQEEIEYSQREMSFRNTMRAIHNETQNNEYEILDWGTYESRIQIQNEDRVLFSVYTNEPEEDIDDGELPQFSNTVDDRILFLTNLENVTRDEFNTILPDIDYAIMKLLYLRFDLTQIGRDLLNLALTNSFIIKERKGKIKIDELEALENNEYNNYNEDANKAISALAIVGANQLGRTYYSGYEEPVELLRRLQEDRRQELRK